MSARRSKKPLKDDASTIGARMRKLGYPAGATYAHYLASPHWAEVRRRWFAANPSKLCECGKRGTQLHHKTYVRLGAERLADLELLCRGCHEARHGRKSGQRKKPGRPHSRGLKIRHIEPDPQPRDEWRYVPDYSRAR